MYQLDCNESRKTNGSEDTNWLFPPIFLLARRVCDLSPDVVKCFLSIILNNFVFTFFSLRDEAARRKGTHRRGVHQAGCELRGLSKVLPLSVGS